MDGPDVERAMRVLADATGTSRLPDAELVWRRASALARYAQSEKATRPIRIVEWAACVACAAAGIGCMVVWLPELGAGGGRVLVTATATLVIAAMAVVECVWADE